MRLFKTQLGYRILVSSRGGKRKIKLVLFLLLSLVVTNCVTDSEVALHNCYEQCHETEVGDVVGLCMNSCNNNYGPTPCLSLTPVYTEDA